METSSSSIRIPLNPMQVLFNQSSSGSPTNYTSSEDTSTEDLFDYMRRFNLNLFSSNNSSEDVDLMSTSLSPKYSPTHPSIIRTTVSSEQSKSVTMSPVHSSTFSIDSMATDLFDAILHRNSTTKPTPSPTSEVSIFDTSSASDTIENFVDFNDTSYYVNKPKFDLTTAITNDDDSGLFSFNSLCYSSPEDYELITSMLCSSLLVLGVVYFTYGYRCFRALAFFAGLVFGTILTYSLCTAENLIAFQYGNLIISLSVGIFIALLTMLVTYIGLFVIGLHLGLLLGSGLLIVIYLLRPYYEILQPPLSALTLLIFFVAVSLVGALSTVYFSKGNSISLTIMVNPTRAIIVH